jgi:hypothetical protein
MSFVKITTLTAATVAFFVTFAQAQDSAKRGHAMSQTGQYEVNVRAPFSREALEQYIP